MTKSSTKKKNAREGVLLLFRKEKKCIQTIEKILNIQFNGKTLDDVSIFISYFIEASKTKRYIDEQIELAKYDGLSWEDLMM